MRYFGTSLIVLLTLLISGVASPQTPDQKKLLDEARKMSKETCLKYATPSPIPLPVNTTTLIALMKELKSVDGKTLLSFTPALEKEVKEIFDVNLVQTKTEQFYRLVYFVYSHLVPGFSRIVQVDPVAVRKILVVASIFLTPEIPNKIIKLTIDRSRKKDPKFAVKFDGEETHMPMNEGRGYYAYTHGLCQFTTALVFYEDFSFVMRVLKNGNIIARYFKGIDFYGAFGTRGMFDIDFDYVAIESVEFYKNTKIGEVVAAISRNEFKKNEHNALLRIITRFVKNSSTQSLGW